MTYDEIKKLNTDNCQNFRAFAKNKLPMPGTKKRLEDVLNKEIMVVDYRITKSNKQENTNCLQIQFVESDAVYVLFTGSAVLQDQIQDAKENMPFKTTIVKVDRYYSFS